MFSFFQISNPALTTQTQGLESWGFFQEIVPTLVVIGLVAGTLVFFFILMVGAIGWITAGSNKQSVEAAKDRIVQGFIGLVIMFFIFLFVQMVNALFGINIGQLGVPDGGGGGNYGVCSCDPLVNNCNSDATPVCENDVCTCEPNTSSTGNVQECDMDGDGCWSVNDYDWMFHCTRGLSSAPGCDIDPDGDGQLSMWPGDDGDWCAANLTSCTSYCACSGYGFPEPYVTTDECASGLSPSCYESIREGDLLCRCI